MSTATITSKGQITIPVDIRRRFGLEPGDQLDFWEDEGSALRLTPRLRRADDFFGALHSDAPAPSVEQMDDAIGEAATQAALR